MTLLFYMIIVLVVAVTGLILTIIDKNKEIKELKAIIASSNKVTTNTKTIDSNDKSIRIVDNMKFCPDCGCDLVHYDGYTNVNSVVRFCPECGCNLCPTKEHSSVPESKDSPVVKESKPKYTDKEIKNSLILITGSVLVIISALLFLTTTWSFTDNIVKTLLLVLMLVVFFAAGHIADNVLHLKQTAKAFRYIGLYFLPIVLFSISLFSLLGYDLSINGPSKYVYFFLSSLIVTGVYYYSAVKYNSTLIKVSTIIFSVISVIMGTLIFTTDGIIVMIVLSLYLFILNYLYTRNKYFFDRNIHVKTLATLLGSFFVLSFNFLLFNCLSITLTDIFLDVITFANVYYFFSIIINKKKVFENIYPAYLILLFLHFSGLIEGFIPTQLLLIASFVVVIVTEFLLHKRTSLGSYIEIITFSGLYYILTLAYTLFGDEYIEPYYFILTLGVVSLIHYLSNRNREGTPYRFTAYVFSSSLLFAILNIIITHDLSYNYLGFASLGMLLLLNHYKKNDSLANSFNIVGLVGCGISSIVMDYTNIFTAVLFLFFTLYSMFKFFDKGYKQYRYSSYICYNLHLISLLLWVNKNLFLITNDFYLIIPITAILFVALEKLISKYNDNSNHIYLLIHLIISVALLFICEFTIPNLAIFVISSLVFIYYIKSINYKEAWLLCPYIGIIMYLHIKWLPYDYTYFKDIFNYISIGMLALFGCLLFKKKNNIYSVLYYLNAYAYIFRFIPNKYFGLLLIVIGTLIAFFVNNNKIKDIYKTVLLVCGLTFVRYLISDFDLESITLINIGIYILWVPLVTRLIVRKYSTIACKILEYIANVIINMWAFFSYTSEYDGLLFVIFLTLVVIISYSIKLGPIFLVSICSIVINVFILTREFWLAIPWWIYVLIIGIILISFAVYNEINANKKKNNVIKEISKKVDL